MPIYCNSGRRSVIPNFHKRISNASSQNRQPRKSSPYPFQVEPFQSKVRSQASGIVARFQSLTLPINPRKKFLAICRKYTSISNYKRSCHSQKKECEITKRYSAKNDTPRKADNQTRMLPEKGNLSRRSLYRQRTSTMKERRGSSDKEEKDLAFFCQLLLLKTVTPQFETENIALCDEFNHQLDERYFEYYPYIFKYLCGREQLIRFNNNYLAANNFTSNFRCILIDWMIKVQLYSKVSTESLQVAVTLTDMFTSMALIRRSFYQLVGVAGLLIGCKVVQRFHPKIKNLCHLTDGCYLPTHIIQMERIMLEKLNFFVNVPIAGNFYHRGLLACVEIVDTSRLDIFCSYMFDMILLEPSSPGLRPSCKAASAILIGRYILYPEYSPWTKILHHYTLYDIFQLRECVMLYVAMLINIYDNKDYPYTAVLSKYSLSIWKCIAKESKLIEFSKSKKAQASLERLFHKTSDTLL